MADKSSTPTGSASGASLFPAMNSPQRQGNATGSLRNKVALPKGRSLMDWIRLGNSGVDLTGVGGRLIRVSPEELKKHNTREDCWMAINGAVYNITQYCEFHPGGIAELMKGAGKDGTQLFNEVHRWVNYESMLRKCLVGKLVTDSIFHRAPQYGNSLAPPRAMGTQLQTVNTPQTSSAADNMGGAMKAPLPFSKPPPPPDKPRYDYFQNDTHVKVSIYTRTPGVTADNMILERPEDGNNVRITVYLPSKKIYRLHFAPSHSLGTEYRIKSASGIGKIEIDFNKIETSVKWTRLGEFLEEHNSLVDPKTAVTQFIACKIGNIEQLTHDTRLYTIELPQGYRMIVPYHHVSITASLEGMEICRSYTPVCRLKSTNQPSTTSLEFIIKIYSDGALTQHINSLNLDESIKISHHTGSFSVSQLEGYSNVLLLAAGTGFTPMTKLLTHCVSTNKQSHLVFFNKTYQDIIWRDELENFRENSKGCVRVTHVLSQPDSEWQGLSGRLTDDMMQNFIPADTKSQTFIAACGPIPFIKLVQRILSEMSLQEKQVHIFQE